jgi:predicted dinucleotide-binding enzyme
MKIVLIGSGNIATHLGKAFSDAGHQIVPVLWFNIRGIEK